MRVNMKMFSSETKVCKRCRLNHKKYNFGRGELTPTRNKFAPLHKILYFFLFILYNIHILVTTRPPVTASPLDERRGEVPTRSFFDLHRREAYFPYVGGKRRGKQQSLSPRGEVPTRSFFDLHRREAYFPYVGGKRRGKQQSLLPRGEQLHILNLLTDGDSSCKTLT